MRVENRADYAEFFEAIDEFNKSKIARGTSVVLEGDKIRPAKKKEIPFGVITSFPIMIGCSGSTDAGKNWGGKYELDDFGNYILEDVEYWSIFVNEKTKKENGKDVEKRIRKSNFSDIESPLKGATIKIVKRRKINKEYDPSKEYIPRRLRPEWNIVGLLGKVKILKGQPVSPNWIKLKDISDKVEEWLIR